MMSFVKTLTNVLRILSWTMFISIFISLFCILPLQYYLCSLPVCILVNKAVYKAYCQPKQQPVLTQMISLHRAQILSILKHSLCVT